jgi:hypothetical protein
MDQVHIGRDVKPRELERALINAAEEVQWYATSEDIHRKNYQLACPEKREEKYLLTEIMLRSPRATSAVARILLDKKGPTTSNFSISSIGNTPDEQIQGYLKAVSRNLKK